MRLLRLGWLLQNIMAGEEILAHEIRQQELTLQLHQCGSQMSHKNQVSLPLSSLFLLLVLV